jgi:hypothetical protein
MTMPETCGSLGERIVAPAEGVFALVIGKAELADGGGIWNVLAPPQPAATVAIEQPRIDDGACREGGSDELDRWPGTGSGWIKVKTLEWRAGAETALFDTLREGFKVFAVVDAVGGTTLDGQEAGLQHLIEAGGQPTTWV